MSFPYSVGQVPVYYNRYNTGRPQKKGVQERFVSQYLDIPNEPLFPFGFGLSYTTFSYSDVTLSSSVIKPEQPLHLTVNVTNTGEVAGDEVVQLYVRDITGEVVRPLRELKGFKKIWLEPGETKEVAFTLTEEQLRYYHSDLSHESDAGKFNLYIGANSRDAAEYAFELIK